MKRLDSELQQFIDNCHKIQPKNATISVSNNIAGAMVGDVLRSAWGYDQTNYDFYEVIKTTPKTVTLRKLSAFACEGEVILKNKRVHQREDGYIVRIASYESAFFHIDDPKQTRGKEEAWEDLKNPYRSQH